MMSAIPTPRYTLEEYLARERVAEYKSEFYRGEIFAMAGGSPRHNRICRNLLTALHTRLRGQPCEPFGSDQRLRIPPVGLSTYPDISIICGELQQEMFDHDASVNPRVLIEVLSDSTERYCRGKKFHLYQQLESLREYILVAQDEPLIERYVRQENDAWLLTTFQGLEAELDFPTVGCSIPLAEIYEGVKFGPEEE